MQLEHDIFEFLLDFLWWVNRTVSRMWLWLTGQLMTAHDGMQQSNLEISTFLDTTTCMRPPDCQPGQCHHTVCSVPNIFYPENIFICPVSQLRPVVRLDGRIWQWREFIKVNWLLLPRCATVSHHGDIVDTFSSGLVFLPQKVSEFWHKG